MIHGIVPYQVALLVFFGGSQKFCVGSLISVGHVLTAAHCTHGADKIQVIMGAINYKDDEPSQIIVTSEKWQEHPGWSEDTMVHDISIISLPYPVQQNDFINIITLDRFELSDRQEEHYDGTVFYTGWNQCKKDCLTKQIPVKLMGDNECKQVYKNQTRSTICTSGSNPFSCYGFSGAPLLIGHKQIGILSHGSQKCDPKYPLVFTKVADFIRWIDEVIGND